MLVAAMTTPWAILDQLQAWAELLGDHIDKLNLDNEVWQHCRQQSKSCSWSKNLTKDVLSLSIGLETLTFYSFL